MDRKGYLRQIEKVIAQGPYRDSWESLCEHPAPDWYQKAKFGIFIHWGVYSVPEFGSEWYPRHMYKENSRENRYHVKKYGALNQFGYKDFIPEFRAENFQADEWGELFQAAGARFIVPVGEHHDGFQMYDSGLSRWNAVQMGPKRDILEELKEQAGKRGMMFGASSHRAEHWWFFNHGRLHGDTDVCDPEYQELYGPAAGITRDQDSLYDNPPDEAFLEDWLLRTCEMVDRYQPALLYFDWWIQVSAFKPYLRKFAAYYYNRSYEWGLQIAIAAKFDSYVHKSAVKDVERGKLGGISPDFWQSDTSTARNSWCYTKDNIYKPAEEILWDLIDVVSKNGALLLNIGPKADGTIAEEERKILMDIGAWLAINGEAVYGTTYWKTYGEGPTQMKEGHFQDQQAPLFTPEDIRFTAKANYIYAIVMRWPVDGIVRIHSLGRGAGYLVSAIRNIQVLGQECSPLYEYRGDWLEVTTGLKTLKLPVVLKIEIE